MPTKVPTHGPAPAPRKAWHPRYDRTRRDPQAKSFYNRRAWRDHLRAIKLRDQPQCELCWAKGDLVRATHVHHIVEIKQDMDLSMALENLQSLCSSHHSRLHAARRGRAAGTDASTHPRGLGGSRQQKAGR
jgi:5-methylcytosine-specific restriction protein A